MAWLVAFLVHSTLWLGLAWCLTRLRSGVQARLRESIWLAALAASLIAPTAVILVVPGASTLWRIPVPAALLEAPATATGEVGPVRGNPAAPGVGPEARAGIEGGRSMGASRKRAGRAS